MKLFFLILSVVFIFAACGDSKVKINVNDDESSSDSDVEQVGDSDEEQSSDTDNETVDDKEKDDDTKKDDIVNDNDSVDAFCGNDIVETGEDCDGNVKLCTEIDEKLYSGGKALCKDDCSGFSTVTCDEVPYKCGDNVTEGPEICDGGVEDCINIDATLYASGKAKCNKTCDGYDLETCVEIFHECGNSIVEGPEVCDKNLKDCVDISSSLYSGGKAVCNGTCSGWDTITCEENTGQCSDTVRVIQCTNDASKDQIQSCSGGSWSNEGDCFEKDEYILLRSGDSSKSYSVTFSSTIDDIDVLTIMDTSGSLTEELGIIKSNVSSMTNAIVADYPDVAFGMSTLGTLEYEVYSIIHEIDETVSNYVSKVSSMTTTATGATEYHTAAIDQAVSGSGTYQQIKTSSTSSTVYTVSIPAASCSSWERGGLCFRENSFPVVVVISDEEIAMDDWIWDSGSKTTTDDVADSLNAINGKIGIIDAGGDSEYMSGDADDLAFGTNSYDFNGNAFYKAIPYAGTGLSNEWIAMVKSIIDDTIMDIELDITQGASNPINVFNLIDTYTAFSASPSSGIDGKSGAEFLGVERHTDLTYKVVFSNNGSSTGVEFNELTLSALWGDIVVGTKTITVVTD